MIDKNKTYRTRGGHEVRIYATDGGGEYPVHGVTKLNGEWSFNDWTECGGHEVEVDESEFDLIEVKPRIKREVWVNVYPEWLSSDIAWPSKKNADKGAAPDRIACVRLTIDCEEGEGL